MSKASTTADLLWPYLLPKIQRTVNGSAGNGTSTPGVGGAPTPHSLSSTHHTGLLADAQATQFLMLNGSRALTGNLPVNAGITIDGVDLGAFKVLYDIHVADPDAHHDTATAGNGITITGGGQVVAVNQAYGFTWTGTHQFNLDPQINANLDFIGGDRLITANADLTVSPVDDLWLNPGGLIMLPDDQEMRSATIADLPTGINGIRLWERSDAVNYWQLTMGAIKVDELYARVFVADEVRIDRGEEYWSKSYGVVETDFVLPALAATVDVWFEDAPALLGANLFSAGDWLLFRVIDWGVGLLIMKCWFQVVSLQASDAVNDRQQWRLTRKKFGTTGVKVKKGNVALDAGQVGQGWIHLSALNQDGGPFIQIGDFTSIVSDEPIFTNRTRMGNLNGTVDYSVNTWGFAAGNNLGLTPSGGFSGLTADAANGLRLFNTDIVLYEASTPVVSLTQADGLSLVLDSAYGDNTWAMVSWFDNLSPTGDALATLSAWGTSLDSNMRMVAVSPDVTGVANVSMVAESLTAVVMVEADSSGWIALRSPKVYLGGNVSAGGALHDPTTTLHVYDNDASVDAGVGVVIEQDGTGDAVLHWYLTAGQYFSAGIDNSVANDVWKLSASNTLGTSDFIVIDPVAGTVVINGLTGGSAVSGMTGGDGITLAGSDIAVDTTVVRTTRTLTAGDGLTGGGDLSANRTFDVDSTVARTTTDILAGAGLTGGGSIAADRTLTVGAGAGITVNADDVAVDLATTSGLNVTSGLALDDTVAGAGITITAKVLNVIALSTGGLTVNANDVQIKLPASSGLTTDATGLFIADTVAGAGLVIASKVLAVGAGSGIAVAANDVAVDLATTSGLNLTSGLAVGAGDGIDVLTATVAVDVTDIIDTAAGIMETSNNIQVRLETNAGLQFGGAGGVQLGTPTTLTVATTNSVTTVTHSHAITASADVGTTPVAALLKSTAAGGLIVANFEAKGSILATNSGNLYVAGSIGGASGVMITLGDRVGFGRIPDPQFMVDVNGPLRADWLIGKQALQLKDAVLLSHFDGGAPDATNFTGETSGHRGQVGTVVGGAIFRPAKFGKGLQAAAAKTNICTNPSFEVDLTSWTTANGGTWTRDTTDAVYGVACLKGVITVGGSHAKYFALTGLTVGAIYAVSVSLKAETPGTTCRFYACNSSFANQVYSATVAEGGWVRESVSFTVGADGGLRVVLFGDNAGTFYFDAVQIELDYLTPYLDGSLSVGPGLVATGHVWSGTAHASNSSRTNGRIAYATAENIKADRGTIMAWVYVNAGSPSGTNGILEAASGVWTYFNFYMTTSGTTPRLTVGNAAGVDEAIGPAAPGIKQWVHVACTWDIYAQQAIVYTNGVAGTPIVMDNLPLLGSSMAVGGKTLLGSDRYINGMIDDLVILNRVAAANEILSVYESDAPVFAVSSVFTFRATPTGLVWADENGLWMRDVNGNAVMGMYGGEAATFSWGGKSLAKGDILFGRYGTSDGGWMYFDRDGVSSKPFLSLGYEDQEVMAFDEAGASLTGVLDISTSGGIYQGTGTSSSPTTGLRIWNQSGIGRIAGWNAGVVQWYANTDGKLYVGEGRVRMDATGIWTNDVGLDEVFAVNAGAVNQAWGGLTLAEGDVMIGDYDRGAYLHWDDSLGSLVVGKVAAGFGNLFVDEGNVSVRLNTTERIGMTAAGVLTIKDSGGAAVFTFNASAGAEFTKPLTLGTSGGIYQGTGTFASPTTGLKIWNSSGIGLISGYNTGVLQWYANTDGKLYAGGGNVKMDANGVHLTIASAVGVSNSVNLEIGGALRGYLSGRDDGSSSHTVDLYAASVTGHASTIQIRAEAPTALSAAIILDTFVASVATGMLAVGAGGAGQVEIGKSLYINQSSSTFASAAMQMNQADLSEEFIRFNGTVTTGNPINQSALGAYYGRVRVSVNGTFKWLALYD